MDFWADLPLTEVYHLQHAERAKVVEDHGLEKPPHEHWEKHIENEQTHELQREMSEHADKLLADLDAEEERCQAELEFLQAKTEHDTLIRAAYHLGIKIDVDQEFMTPEVLDQIHRGDQANSPGLSEADKGYLRGDIDNNANRNNTFGQARPRLVSPPPPPEYDDDAGAGKGGCCGGAARRRSILDELVQKKYRRPSFFAATHENPAAQTTSAICDSNVRVLSYNMFLRPLNPSDIMSNHYKGTRLRIFKDEILQKYDVLCLQEMFGSLSLRRKNFLKHAQTVGFHSVASPAPSNWTSGLIDGGLVILSRWKIISKAYMTYSAGTWTDALAMKGVLYAMLQPADGHMCAHVFTTHLQATYAGDQRSVQKQREVRRSQIKELVSFMRMRINDCEAGRSGDIPPESRRRWPIILGGDFNINARPGPDDPPGAKHSDEYLMLLNELKKVNVHARDLLFQKDGTHPVTIFDSKRKETLLSNQDDAAFMPDSSLDYVFFMQNQSGTEVDCLLPTSAKIEPFLVKKSKAYPGTQLSDHYGVDCNFTWVRPRPMDPTSGTSATIETSSNHLTTKSSTKSTSTKSTSN